MSLSILNNSVSSSALPKGEGKASISEGDAGENPGFWDKFKEALSSEPSEVEQKVEGSGSRSKSTSELTNDQSTDAMLEDVATQTKPGEAAEPDEAVSDVKVEKMNKVDTAVLDEGADSSVKKMTDESALADAAQIDAEKPADPAAVKLSENNPSADKPATDAAKTGADAEQAVSENAELLSRLNESNKALKPPVDANIERDVEAAEDVAITSQTLNSIPKSDQSTSQLVNNKPELTDKQTQLKDTTLAGASSAQLVEGEVMSTNESKLAYSNTTGVTSLTEGPSAHLEDNKLKPAKEGDVARLAEGMVTPMSENRLVQPADGKFALTPDGKAATPNEAQQGKLQTNIAWSQADTELAAKSEVKASLAGTVSATEKTPPSAGSFSTASTIQTQLTAQPQSSTQAIATAAHAPIQGAQATAQPANEMAAAAAMMAGGRDFAAQEATKASSSIGAQVAGANINGIKGGNKSQNPASVGGDTALQATGALTTAGSLRTEQQAPAVSNVQSPMVLTKENVSDQVAERVQMMMSKNLKHVDIRLDPPELGRMQIRMSLNNDSATVHFTVQHQQTRDMVDQAMPRLREMLSQQGIQLADTSVEQQGQQRQASHGSGSGSANETSDSASDVGSFESGPSVELAVKQNKDGISYYA
jgi:flagellar hook-length control protein FliK